MGDGQDAISFAWRNFDLHWIDTGIWSLIRHDYSVGSDGDHELEPEGEGVVSCLCEGVDHEEIEFFIRSTSSIGRLSRDLACESLCLTASDVDTGFEVLKECCVEVVLEPVVNEGLGSRRDSVMGVETITSSSSLFVSSGCECNFPCREHFGKSCILQSIPGFSTIGL